MVTLISKGVYLKNNIELSECNYNNYADAKKGTIAYNILTSHNTSGDNSNLKIKFDAMASHDITYVGIIQTAKASGLNEFPMPYVLTNCHNSLCAVGGTINEDDHVFGLSAAKKYGGIYVPAHQAVIHQYMREQMAACGKMILGSDSHTRYGALGTMAIGEGGGELAKQLLNKTYDIAMPDVICVYLKGSPKPYVGPQDIALAIIEKVFANGFVKNKVMEFTGPGIANLSVDFRNGIDVMTTETTCLSSIWVTDEKVKEYFEAHQRYNAYKKLAPKDIAYYEGAVIVELDKIEPMIALPFHPSNVYKLSDLIKNPYDIFDKVEKEAKQQLDNKDLNLNLKNKIFNNKIKVDQAIIAGCAGGTFENICHAGDTLENCALTNDAFSLSVYPSSQPVYYELLQNGTVAKLMNAGAIIKTAFCGPCFGAGDVPSNNAFSIRHTTRNFPNREGSKPSNNQIASVALMDSKSIAATALNGGFLTSAADINIDYKDYNYKYNDFIYKSRVYNGYKNPDKALPLQYGPNIADWPEMSNLTENILLKVASYITDPVTTTDELIPSGETSSYRSNPLKLAEFTLSRKDPKYVSRAKEIYASEKLRLENKNPAYNEELKDIFEKIETNFKNGTKNMGIGSVIYANKPGDGSAREQAASCQKVLGGWANIAKEYATKRYRSNLINWGMLPFIINEGENEIGLDDYLFIPDILDAVKSKREQIDCYIVNKDFKKITLELKNLTDDERKIICAGCLINYYK